MIPTFSYTGKTYGGRPLEEWTHAAKTALCTKTYCEFILEPGDMTQYHFLAFLSLSGTLILVRVHEFMPMVMCGHDKIPEGNPCTVALMQEIYNQLSFNESGKFYNWETRQPCTS